MSKTSTIAIVLLVLGGLLAACGQATSGPATSGSASRPAASTVFLQEGTADRGSHWRLQTDHGAVHVWRPKGYQPDSAGTVVYVHGYYTDVDTAWKEQQLSDQFAESRRNALFVAIEAPASNEQGVFWASLDDLLGLAWEKTGLQAPPGTLVTLAHSGGFRTVACWLGNPRLAEIILLDGFYGEEEGFARWLQQDDTARKRLILIASHTAQNSLQFISQFAFAVSREGYPDGHNPPFSDRERRARLLYVYSQYEHMGLVNDGLIIPTVLGLATLGELPRQNKRMPWE
jgi:hypothetical protein